MDRKKMLCSNCGKYGHEYKSCLDPITSVGIINIKLENSEFNEYDTLKYHYSGSSTIFKLKSKNVPKFICYYTNNVNIDRYSEYTSDATGVPQNNLNLLFYYKDKIKFLMVSRKFSLGFIEFVRGRYNIDDVNSIINLLQQMTQKEIDFIGNNEYDDILYKFANKNDKDKISVLNKIYQDTKLSNEYFEAKYKFKKISGYEDNRKWNLKFLTNNIKPSFD